MQILKDTIQSRWSSAQLTVSINNARMAISFIAAHLVCLSDYQSATETEQIFGIISEEV